MVTMNRANTSVGRARAMLTKPLMVTSTHLPKYPATVPKRPPNTTPMPTEGAAMDSDSRLPHTDRENMSRPNWSVPNQCDHDGPSSGWPDSGLWGSSRNPSQGASTAPAITRASHAADSHRATL